VSRTVKSSQFWYRYVIRMAGRENTLYVVDLVVLFTARGGVTISMRGDLDRLRW
jgi:hypothetical protein